MWKPSTLAYETWINFQNICYVSKLRKSLQRERWRTYHKDPFYKSKMKKVFQFELQWEADAQSQHM